MNERVRKQTHQSLLNRGQFMRYHFNSDTGKTRQCQANIRECPLIHGDSPSDAVNNYEEAMMEHTFTKMSRKEKKRTPREFQQISAEILSKTPLKDLDTTELSQTIRYESHNAGMDGETIDSAIALASILHAKQYRGPRTGPHKAPYIEHPLRNSLRLLRLGVKDQDVVLGSLLHDTVEDGAPAFAKKFYNQEMEEVEARELLTTHIGNAYGERTQHLVQSVTNDYTPLKELQAKTLEQRHQEYRSHVIEQVSKDPGTFLIKVSDFIDNATGLYHTDVKGSEKATLKRATKYLPLTDELPKIMNNLSLPISKENEEVVRGQILRTKARLTEIIAKHS